MYQTKKCPYCGQITDATKCPACGESQRKDQKSDYQQYCDAIEKGVYYPDPRD